MSFENWQKENQTGFSKWQQQNVATIPGSPDEEINVSEDVLKKAIDLELSIKDVEDNYPAFVAAPEESKISQLFQKYIRDPLTEHLGLFKPDIGFRQEGVPEGLRWDRVSKLKTELPAAALHITSERISGLGLSAPDILAQEFDRYVLDSEKPITTLAELVAKITKLQATGKTQQAAEMTGQMFKFFGGLKTARKILGPLINRLPVRQSLRFMFGGGVRFITVSLSEEVSEKITLGEDIDWNRVHKAAGWGVVFGGVESLGGKLAQFKDVKAAIKFEPRLAKIPSKLLRRVVEAQNSRAGGMAKKAWTKVYGEDMQKFIRHLQEISETPLLGIEPVVAPKPIPVTEAAIVKKPPPKPSPAAPKAKVPAKVAKVSPKAPEVIKPKPTKMAEVVEGKMDAEQVAEQAALSPALAQWHKLKANNPDLILIVKMGDFYELFNEDAQTATKVLGKKLQIFRGSVPNVSIPFHEIEKAKIRFIQEGYKIAIAEQIDKAKPFSDKNIKRDIVRITDEEIIEIPTPTKVVTEPEVKPPISPELKKDFGFDVDKPKPPIKTKAVTRPGFVDLTPLAEAGPQIKTISEKASKLVTRFGGLDSEVRKALIEYEEQLRELPNVIAKDSIKKFGKLTPEQEDILQKHRENPKKFPDLPEELKPALETLEKDIKEGGKRFEELGYPADWPNTYIDRLEKKLTRLRNRKVPDPEGEETLEAAIKEARDLRYLHHFYEKDSVGKGIINRFRRAVSKRPKGLLGRKIPTLEKAKELGLKPAPLAVSHSHFMHELARAEAASDLITAINSNPELSLPEHLAPEEWVKLDERTFPASVQHRTFVNEEGKPIHIKKFRKYPIPIAEALEEIAYTRNFSALERAYDKLNFSMKIIGFYNPLIMTKNDAVQLWRASGLRGAIPLLLPKVEFDPISIKPPRAVQIFAEKGAEYEKLRKAGLFNNIVNYTPPVTELSDLMLKHIRETSGEQVARIAKEWLNPANFFKNLRKFNEATTWNMDEIMRIAAYEAVKDTTMLEGMTDFEKIEWVNDAMVNYGKLPNETKRWLNKAIFTPSYRIGNFRYFWGQIAKYPWRMKGPLLRTVGYKMFIRWGLPAIVSAAIFWKTGEKRDVRTEKGYKLIITNPKTNTDTVYSLSDPLLEGVKITQRPIRQTLALNLAAIPSLLVRLMSGPRFKQSRDRYGEFFKLGTPIYRDVMNWTDPDKTVPQQILSQFAVAFVYTRRAREEDKGNVLSAMAKTLSIWTDWKEQAADLNQIISGRKYYLGPGGKFGRLLRKFKVEQDIDRDELDMKIDGLLGRGETSEAIKLMLVEGRYESEEGISGKILKFRAPIFYYWQVMSKKERVEFTQWLIDNKEYGGNEVDELVKALQKSVKSVDRETLFQDAVEE